MTDYLYNKITTTKITDELNKIEPTIDFYSRIRNLQHFNFSFTYIINGEGSNLPSNRNSPKCERIENAPLAILISTKQFNSMLV